MFKLIVFVGTLLIGGSLADSPEYPPEGSPYAGHPYYPPLEGSQHFVSPDAQPRSTHHYHPEGMPPMDQGTLPMDERFGGFFPPPFPGAAFGLGFGGPPPPPAMPPPGLPDGFRQGPPPNGPIGPPPFGFPDPGFQTQTGFEGLLVPNTWYGLLPWGIEGVIIVIAGIIVFAIIVIAILGLLGWLCGVKTVLPIIKDEYPEAEARSRFGDQWAESLTDLSANVIQAIERFNDAMSEESEGEEEDSKHTA